MNSFSLETENACLEQFSQKNGLQKTDLTIHAHKPIALAVHFGQRNEQTRGLIFLLGWGRPYPTSSLSKEELLSCRTKITLTFNVD